jgi:hypothetical protein
MAFSVVLAALGRDLVDLLAHFLRGRADGRRGCLEILLHLLLVDLLHFFFDRLARVVAGNDAQAQSRGCNQSQYVHYDLLITR